MILPALDRYFSPIFTRELLEATQIFGLGLTLENPVKARLILRLKSTKAAEDLAKEIRENPQRWLRLQDSELLLFAQPPEITTQAADLEIRCNVPENSARLLLQRIAKTNPAPAMASQ